MKNSIFIILLLLFFSCNKKTNNLAEIEINKVQNFGDIKVGDTVKKTFYIKNLSKNTLIIKDLKTSCGCTVVKIKDSLIEKGTGTNIITQYIAEPDDIGLIEKSIIIEANTDPTFTVLYLKGKVIK
jgi:hypothetical protein